MDLLFAQTVPAPWLGEGALAGLAAFLLSAWLNEWIVSGKLYRSTKDEAQKRLDTEAIRAAKELERAQREVDYWRNLALTNLGLAEKAVTLAEARQ